MNVNSLKPKSNPRFRRRNVSITVVLAAKTTGLLKYPVIDIPSRFGA